MQTPEISNVTDIATTKCVTVWSNLFQISRGQLSREEANVKWNWGELEQTCFDEVKKFITSELLLVHYDVNKLTTIHCDTLY